MGEEKRLGDITGFDDAEIIEVEEEQEDKTQSVTKANKILIK